MVLCTSASACVRPSENRSEACRALCNFILLVVYSICENRWSIAHFRRTDNPCAYDGVDRISINHRNRERETALQAGFADWMVLLLFGSWSADWLSILAWLGCRGCFLLLKQKLKNRQAHRRTSTFTTHTHSRDRNVLNEKIVINNVWHEKLSYARWSPSIDLWDAAKWAGMRKLICAINSVHSHTHTHAMRSCVCAVYVLKASLLALFHFFHCRSPLVHRSRATCTRYSSDKCVKYWEKSAERQDRHEHVWNWTLNRCEPHLNASNSAITNKIESKIIWAAADINSRTQRCF